MLKGPRNTRIIDLPKYRLPITGIVSILHRISGVLLFLFIPFVLWLLHHSLISQQEFLLVKDFMGSFTISIFIWIVLSALWYHTIAGIKHLLMDMDYFEGKRSGAIASTIVMLLGIAGVIAIGVWILC